MGILALDLSKRSTGWAVWQEGWEKPRYGHWQLGSEFTSEGQTYATLHRNLADLRAIARFDRIYFEEAINPAALSGHTNIDTLRVLSGLCAHAESFGYAMGCRTYRTNISTWRRDFLGSMEITDAKRRAKAIGKSASADLKELTMERARQLGMNPRKSDEADAIGILDYACTALGIMPPWRSTEALRPLLPGSRK